MQCPSCNTPLAIARLAAFSEMTCPTCGKALWFVRRLGRVDVFDFAESARVRSQLVGRLAYMLNTSEDAIRQAARTGQLFPDILDKDSVDVMEWLDGADQE